MPVIQLDMVMVVDGMVDGIVYGVVDGVDGIGVVRWKTIAVGGGVGRSINGRPQTIGVFDYKNATSTLPRGERPQTRWEDEASTLTTAPCLVHLPRQQ